MTLEESILYIFDILNSYWKDNHNDELGQFLSELNPIYIPGTRTISTGDPAAWYDWVESIQKLLPYNRASQEALKRAKQAHEDLFDWIDKNNKLFAEKQITKEELVKATRENDDEPAWDGFVEAVRETLPDGQIVVEQAKKALAILMQEYNNQGFDLTEIINKIEYIFNQYGLE
jgi:hypothetical protein